MTACNISRVVNEEYNTLYCSDELYRVISTFELHGSCSNLDFSHCICIIYLISHTL